jgi:hypothetical protein
MVHREVAPSTVQEPVVRMDHDDAEIDGMEVTLDASTVMAD